MLGLGLSVGALARCPPAAAGPALWDYDLTAGVLPSGLALTRATSGGRVAASGLIAIEAANTPRFDYDPVSHVCRGLLIESQATYFGQKSEDVGVSPWVLGTGLTLTTPTMDSPLRVADTVSRVGSGTASFSAVNLPGAVVSSGRIVQHWLVRNVDSVISNIVLRDGAASAQVNVSITWASATAGAAIRSLSAGSPAGGITRLAASVTPYPGGWHLVAVEYTFSPTNTVNYLRLDPSQSPAGRSVDVAAAWSVQAPVGAGPVSYLQTTTGAVTRDADVVTVGDTSRAYRITYTPLAGGSAQTLDVAAGAQPPATPGRWTRVQQL